MSDEVVEPVVAEVEQPKEAPKPEAEIRSQDAEQPELPLAAEPEVAAAEEPVKEPEQTPEQQQDWRDKEIRRKHAQNQEYKRQLAEREKEIEDLRVLAQRPADGSPTPVQSMSQADVQKAAQALRAQEKYQEELISTNAAGEKNYGKEWNAALETLSTLGTVEMDTMRGILATDDPAKVLYNLGKYPAEYQRIMDIPDPARRQTEFVKLSLKTATPKPSNAPAPTEPVRSRVTPTVTLSDKDSDEDWYAKRAAQRAERFKKRA